MNKYIIERLNLDNGNEVIQVNNLVEEAFKNMEHSDHDEHNLIKRLRSEEQYNNDFEIIIKQQSNQLNNSDKSNQHQIIGYALLSEIKIIDHGSDSNNEIKALCLAPIAVLPKFQNQGIGKLLMNEIETIAIKYQYPAISILGSPKYYSRFGYLESSNYNIKATFDIPTEYYMIKQFNNNSSSSSPLSNIKNGKIYYQKSFNI